MTLWRKSLFPLELYLHYMIFKRYNLYLSEILHKENNKSHFFSPAKYFRDIALPL